MIYVLKRIFGILPPLLLVTALTFVLIRITPGGPFDTETPYPPEIKLLLSQKYGLHLPILSQYFLWLKNLLQGDWGESFQYFGQSVWEILWSALQKSALLGVLSLAVSWIGGIILGALSAMRRGTLWDQVIFWSTAAGMSTPHYLTASLLILLFSIHLQWFPAALWGGPLFFVLPVITLSIRPLGVITRYTRRAMKEALSSNYIRTAYAQGVPEHKIIFLYALRNALIAPVSALGALSTHLISGSFLVETLFQIPGLGKHFVTAALNRDYPLLMGATVLYGIILLLMNLVSDLLLVVLDPRITLPGEESSS